MSYTKRFNTIVLSIALSLGFVSCLDKPKEEKELVIIKQKNIHKALINVDGMTCESCESSIQGYVSKIKGVVSVNASHTEKTTIVVYDKTQTNEKEISEVISNIGYKVFKKSQKEALKEAVPSMKCAAGKCGK